jgi:hypothetical protein
MANDFLIGARLVPHSLPPVVTPHDAEDRPGNAVWEEWRLATEPTIEPDASSVHHGSRNHQRTPSPLAQALGFPLLDLLCEEGKGERARGLVGVNVLTIRLAAPYEELAFPAEYGTPAQGDLDGLGDDFAAE